jgi:fructoselysine 6-kinase
VFGPVGNDERGARLVRQLTETSIDPVRVRQLDGVSASQRIVVEPNGERQFCGFEAGVLVDYALTSSELGELEGYDAIALPCSPESRRVFTQCVAAGLGHKLAADFSQDSPEGASSDPATWLAPHLRALAIAFVGGQPEHFVSLRDLSRGSDVPIVLTVGADGAYAMRRGTWLHQPSLATVIVDTTGCGDAFQAGFVVAFLASGRLDTALLRGAELAARVASHRGAAA